MQNGRRALLVPPLVHPLSPPTTRIRMTCFKHSSDPWLAYFYYLYRRIHLPWMSPMNVMNAAYPKFMLCVLRLLPRRERSCLAAPQEVRWWCRQRRRRRRFGNSGYAFAFRLSSAHPAAGLMQRYRTFQNIYLLYIYNLTYMQPN